MRLLTTIILVACVLAAACGSAEQEAPSSDPGVTTVSTNAASSSQSGSASSDVSAAPSGRGTLVDLRIESESLGHLQPVTVYEPPGLSDLDEIPVVYLLHGQMENNRMWASLGVTRAADALISEGAIPPLLIVMPSIDNSFGVNNQESELVDIPDGPSVFYDGNNYEDFLARDLIAFIDDTYPTIDDPKGRFVGGISMGGFAALHLALRQPQLFSRVGAHSPALVRDPGFTWLYPPEAPPAERDPFLLAESAMLDGLEFYLDVGSEDEWGFRQPTEDFAALLTTLGATVQLEVGDGGHSAAYWGPNVEDYLMFYGNGSR
jgi:enterochelin esterase-like enzyme